MEKIKRDYIFTFAGNFDTEKFICSATTGDDAMSKFIRKYPGSAILDIERKEL